MKLKLFLLFFCLAVAKARLVKRLIGGRSAELNSFPNLVSLQGFETDPLTRVHFCGGSIINQLWILITAKCASAIGGTGYPKENVRVYAGKWNLKNFEPRQQIRKVREAYQHPDFDHHLLKSNDIGLVALATALTLNQYVQALPLSTNPDYPSGIAVTAGWGSAYLNQVMLRKPSNILQVKNITLVSRRECVRDLLKLLEANNEYFEESDVNDYIFCSGSSKSTTGSSFFDSGNPIMQSNESGDLEVIGVTSACGGPSLHVQTAPFLSWINSFSSLE